MEAESEEQTSTTKINIKVQIPRSGSMFGMFFSSSKINNWNDVQSSKLEFFKKFHFNMLKNGIYLPPSPFESYFISTSHSKENMGKFSSAIRKSLKHSNKLEEQLFE